MRMRIRYSPPHRHGKSPAKPVKPSGYRIFDRDSHENAKKIRPCLLARALVSRVRSFNKVEKKW